MVAVPLIAIALKVTGVLLAALLVTRAMTRASAALRHLVWTLALVACLAVPVVQFAGPRWDLALLPAAPVEAPVMSALLAAPVVAAPVAPVGSDPIHGSIQSLDTS